MEQRPEHGQSIRAPPPQKFPKALSAFARTPGDVPFTSQNGEIVDILKNMRDTFNSNQETAIMSEKSSIHSDNVLMKIKDDEYAEMKASLKDDYKSTEADDDMPPAEKATKEEGDVEGMPTKIPCSGTA